MKPSILFLSRGSICYDSTACFAKAIGCELEKLGWSAEYVSCPKGSGTDVLEALYGRHYDIILDINTRVPMAQDSNGAYCLDQIDGPVWHYILDHPLYHHDALKTPLQDYHVICLDQNHADYIRSCYPHIRSVHMLPLAANPASASALLPYEQRSHKLVFTGTYTNPNVVLYHASRQDPEIYALLTQFTQLLLEQPDLTQEAAMRQLLPDHADIYDGDFAGFMQRNYLADTYLHACIREELLLQIIRRGLPLTVYGHNWDEFAMNCERYVPDTEDYLQIKGEVPYEAISDIYADTQIALNQMPWFKRGMHDRIPLAMSNGCLCLTDSSAYLTPLLQDGQELYYYSLEDMEKAAQLAQELMENPRTAAKTAARGYEYAAKHFTWQRWAADFLAML